MYWASCRNYLFCCVVSGGIKEMEMILYLSSLILTVAIGEITLLQIVILIIRKVLKKHDKSKMDK